MTNPLLFGIVRISDTLVGVAAHQLQQVVACPATLCSIPESGAVMVGTHVVRDSMVPVVDLRRLVSRDTADGGPAAQLVVVIRCSVGLVGVLAHEVVKVGRVTPEQVGEIRANGEAAPRFFRQCFLEGSRPVYVLGEEVLGDIPGVRFIDQSPQAGGVAGQADVHKGARQRLVFETALTRFACDLDGIQSIEPIPPTENTDASGKFLRGFIRNRDRKVALGNLDEFLNSSESGGAVPVPPTLMLVLSLDERRLALEITKVLGLEDQGGMELLPLSGSSVRGHSFCRGAVCSRQFGDVLVLDHSKLLDAPEVSTLARDPEEQFRLRVRSEAASESDSFRGRPGDRVSCQDPGRPLPQTYIVFRVARQSMAADIVHIEAVLAAPIEMSGTAAGMDAGFRGVTPWQGHPIPIVDTAELMGQGSVPFAFGEAKIIVVRDSDGPRGYLVDGIESLQRATPRNLPIRHLFALSHSQRKTAERGAPSMIGFTEAGQRRNVLVVDLRGLRPDAATSQAGAPVLS